jgi:hypothetical protein
MSLRAFINQALLSLCLVGFVWMALWFRRMRDSDGRVVEKMSDLVFGIAVAFLWLWVVHVDRILTKLGWDFTPDTTLTDWFLSYIWIPCTLLIVLLLRLREAVRRDAVTRLQAGPDPPPPHPESG